MCDEPTETGARQAAREDYLTEWPAPLQLWSTGAAPQMGDPTMTSFGARSPRQPTNSRQTFSSRRWFLRGSIAPHMTK